MTHDLRPNVEMMSKHKWITIIPVVILVQLILILVLETIALTDNFGKIISFLKYYPGGDFYFYNLTTEEVKRSLLAPLIEFFGWQETTTNSATPSFSPGPLYPIFLILTEYRSENIYLFKIITLFSSVCLTCIWVEIFHRFKSYGSSILVYLFNPLSFLLLITPGPDLFYSICVAIIFFITFILSDSARNSAIFFACMCVGLFLKPQGLSLVLVAYAFYFKNIKYRPTEKLGYITAISLLAIYMMSFYSPYLNAYVAASAHLGYWGIQESEYLHKISQWRDTPLQSLGWLSGLVFSKILYAVGIRPSFSDMPLIIVWIRCAAGVILLSGILNLLLQRKYFILLFCSLVVAPSALGASQERYLAPVAPIFLLFGLQFWIRWFRGLK